MGNNSSLVDVPYKKTTDVCDEYINNHKNDYIVNNTVYQKSYKYQKYDIVDEFYDKNLYMIKNRIVLLKNNVRSTTLYYDNGNPYMHEGFEGKKKLVMSYYKNGHVMSKELYTLDCLDGIQSYYYENGYPKRITKYVVINNVSCKNDEDILYDETQLMKKIAVANYKNGILHGSSDWYANNMILKHNNYVDGVLHGKCWELIDRKNNYKCYKKGELITTTFSLPY